MPVTKESVVRGRRHVEREYKNDMTLKNTAAWIMRKLRSVSELRHPGLELLRYLEELDVAVQEFREVKFEGLPFTSGELVDYLPFHVKMGEIHNMDMHDREVGTGTAAAAGHRNHPVFTKDPTNQDDFNARVARFRVNTSTYKIRDRTGDARLLERAKMKKIDFWRREYANDPEYFRNLEEDHRIGRW